jgi:5-hydroxyisourate hydrolase-like protein (transthyretin family)
MTLLSVGIPLRAQSPAKTTATKTARGSVSGRVTIKDKPAPGVVVGLRKSLTSGVLEPFQKATTDQDGVYRITNVAPGNYDVAPSAPAYVIPEVSNSRGKSVIVGEDEDVDDINFALVRGGVITGKITDADGRPLIQQPVNLYGANDLAQQTMRQVFPAGFIQTDDRGIYRFFGLAAGRYKVASGRSDELSGSTYSPTRNIYKQVFHPDVTDQTKATIIDVREGSETANVDITLGRIVQTFTVTGRVINGETGMPAPNIRFGLQRSLGQTVAPSEGVGMANSQGDFVIDGLPPGRYSVFLYPNQSLDLRLDGTTFDIVDQDVSGVTIRLTKGASLSGTIVLEHDDKNAFAKLLEMKVSGYVSPTSANPIAIQPSSSPIAPDGSFRLAGLPVGRLNLNLNQATGFGGQPKGFLISRVENNGVVQPQGIEIKDGDQLTGIRVYVSYGTATLHGTVNFDRGLAPEGARMFARLIKVGPTSVTANALVDTRGHFLLEGMPAGVYEVSISLFVPGTRAQNVAKQQVTLQDGVVSDVTLTLELPAPKP